MTTEPPPSEHPVAPVPPATSQLGGSEPYSEPEPVQPASADHQLVVPHTRTSSTWTGIGIGLVLLLLVIIFIGQNTHDTRLNFLFLHGNVPVGLAVLLAFVLGGIVVLLMGVARLAQLRLMARRHRRNSPTG